MPNALTPAPVRDRLPSDIDALERALDERLEPLNKRQRDFVHHFVRLGNATEAARQAGYSEKGDSAKDTASRLKQHPDVSRAIRAAVALREATADLKAEDIAALLEGMLQVRIEDLLEFNAVGTPIDVRDWETLGIAQQRSIKKLEARVRRSATGRAAHFVDIHVELHSPFEIMDRLAKIRGWMEDSPLFNLTMGTVGDVSFSGEKRVEKALYQLLDLLDDETVAGFFAIPESDQDERAAYLQKAVTSFKTALPSGPVIDIVSPIGDES